jgi:hypothetical protein
MEAICQADFEKRVRAREEAEQAFEQAKKNGKPTDGIIVPSIGFFDIYGVWFSGRLIEIIRQFGRKKFKVDLGDSMHVFVDVEPEKIAAGIHAIMVYAHPCRLYKWTAQGYHRGLVVLADDAAGNARAEMFRQSGTWSWLL